MNVLFVNLHMKTLRFEKKQFRSSNLEIWMSGSDIIRIKIYEFSPVITSQLIL